MSVMPVKIFNIAPAMEYILSKLNKQFCYTLIVLNAHIMLAYAQKHDTASVFNLPVQMDSFVVSTGFDVQAFVRRIKGDTTFYKAFKSMRCRPYSADNDIKAYDKNGAVVASLHSKNKAGGKQWVPCYRRNEPECVW